MKAFGIVSVVALVLASFVGFSFYEFSLSFYEYDVAQKSKIDAVVVLTGGRGRLSPALKLFSNEEADWFLISGVGEKNSLNSIFSDDELRDIDPEKIILEKQSRSTYQNALFAKDILIEKGVRSVLLVTSNYHMKRALFVFRSLFPENIQCIPSSVESDNFNLETWWKGGAGLKLAILEYLKYQWYRWTL